MKILVYSAMNAESVQQNFGAPEYSYFFVLREFMPLLQQLGDVQTVEDPAVQVDPLYRAAKERGQSCVFLSFSPPHLTTLGLACPTIPVFAWEFSSMPNETWWEDQPEQNWAWCLQRCAGAIVHSQQAADVVRKMMGNSFPVRAIPAPLWDRMEPTRTQSLQLNGNPITSIEVAHGTIFDTHDPELERWLPTREELTRALAEARRQIPIDDNKGYRRNPGSLTRITQNYLVTWYQQVLAPRISEPMRSRLDKWAARTDPWQLGRRQLHLNGVVFTSLFNPHDGRKNWLDMLTAFCTEFQNEPEATLVFKLGHRRYEEALEQFLMVLPRLPTFRCRVVLLNGFLSDEAYQELLQGSHFAVNASFGEGQCLPLMEYLSSGKPAVAPCHSALTDYIDEDIAFVVDSWADATTWPHDPRVAYRTLRQQIDWPSLCKAFRNAFECYREHPERYQQMSQTAIKRMQDHCSISVASGHLETLLQQLLEKQPRMTTPTWMRVPSLEEWQHKAANAPDFHDARNAGLTDAVKAGWYQNDTGELFRGFPISAEDVVVDVGCGAGGASLFCARYGAQVVYCDLDPANIESLDHRIKETSARDPRGIVTDCTPLPLDDGFASRIVAMEMLEHVDAPEAVLDELARIGKPGALYLISVPDAAAERLQIPIAPPEYFRKPNHIHIFEPADLEQKIKNAGLEIVERSSYGFFWNLWMNMYWVCDKASKNDPEAVSHDCTKPPYFPLLDDWTSVWARLTSLPEAEPLRRALDEALPKSQIFIARKPLR